MQNSLKYLQFSEYMIEAIKVALRYNPTPNPRVGAVLVDKNNKIKKVAAHKNKGYDHAEYSLFKNSEVSPDDTLYVTLEPCFHDDTSPSCASTVIQTGIKSVVVGDIDKDKRTDGKGIDLLRQNNIQVIVEEGVNEFLNPGYKYSDEKPFLIGKVAISNDNIIYKENNKYISNQQSREISHYIRSTIDCIIIGKNTFIKDEPQLNVRLDDKFSSPTPIVIWGNNTRDLMTYKKNNSNFLFYVENEDGSFNDYVLRNQFKTGLIEGGNKILSYFFEQQQIDKFYMFKSDSNLVNGLKLDARIQNSLKKDFILNDQYQIKDNLLSTYTIK